MNTTKMKAKKKWKKYKKKSEEKSVIRVLSHYIAILSNAILSNHYTAD